MGDLNALPNSTSLKGDWCEDAVLQEIRARKHIVILASDYASNTRGFDAVSWDGAKLHIWEAKNYSTTTGPVSEVSAWLSHRDYPNFAEVRAAIDALEAEYLVTSELGQAASHSPFDFEAARRATQNHNLQRHLRLGSETRISSSLILPSCDIGRYSPRTMNMVAEHATWNT